MIGNISVNAYDSYQVGDIINFHGEDYYVISNSDENSNYVTAFKVKSLSPEEIKMYGDYFNSFVEDFYNKAFEFEDGSGGVSYYSRYGCSVQHSECLRYGMDFCDYSTTNCNNSYETSDVKKIVDKWGSINFNTGDLVEVDGYKYRLISIDDFYNLGYIYDCVETTCIFNYTDEHVNEFFKSITSEKKEIWTMSEFFDYTDVNVTIWNGRLSHSYSSGVDAVNPVINISKQAIINEANESVIHDYQRYKSSYKFGEEVMYKGELYYVLKASNDKEEVVTLIKGDALTSQEIQKYYDGEISNLGKYGLVYNSSSNYNNPSSLKTIVDGWVEDTFGDDAYELDSYKARLLTGDELVEDLFFEYDRISYGQGYIAGDDTPEWAVRGYRYWTMTDYLMVGAYNQGAYHTDSLSGYYYSAAIRPVVNVKKRALSSNGDCEKKNKVFSIKNYKSYMQGEKVTYNNEEYYVANNSGKHLSRVTLIKEHPLTADEIELYGYDDNGRNIVNNYPYSGDAEYIFSDYGYTMNQNDYRRVVYVNTVTPNKAYRYSDGTGGMQYYSSETCGMINNETIEISGCKKNYDESYVKIVVDNWAKDKTNLDDLVSVNGYKVRIINKDEAIYMNNIKNYIYFGSDRNYPEFEYWIIGDDYYYNSGNFQKNDLVVIASYINSGYSNGLFKSIMRTVYGGDCMVFKYPAVWPVINVDKCALEGGCEIEDITMEVCDDSEPPVNPEPVPPTNPEPETEEPEIEDKVTVVDVEDTNRMVSKIRSARTQQVISISKIVISILLICSGVFLMLISSIKNKVKK